MTIPTIDLDAIKLQLFHNPAVRARIARDYDLSPSLDAAALERELLRAFQHMPVAAPLTEQRSNAELFRAAVRSLGSNSRCSSGHWA